MKSGAAKAKNGNGSSNNAHAFGNNAHTTAPNRDVVYSPGGATYKAAVRRIINYVKDPTLEELRQSTALTTARVLTESTIAFRALALDPTYPDNVLAFDYTEKTFTPAVVVDALLNKMAEAAKDDPPRAEAVSVLKHLAPQIRAAAKFAEDEECGVSPGQMPVLQDIDDWITKSGGVLNMRAHFRRVRAQRKKAKQNELFKQDEQRDEKVEEAIRQAEEVREEVKRRDEELEKKDKELADKDFWQEQVYHGRSAKEADQLLRQKQEADAKAEHERQEEERKQEQQRRERERAEAKAAKARRDADAARLLALRDKASSLKAEVVQCGTKNYGKGKQRPPELVLGCWVGDEYRAFSEDVSLTHMPALIEAQKAAQSEPATA